VLRTHVAFGGVSALAGVCLCHTRSWQVIDAPWRADTRRTGPSSERGSRSMTAGGRSWIRTSRTTDGGWPSLSAVCVRGGVDWHCSMWRVSRPRELTRTNRSAVGAVCSRARRRSSGRQISVNPEFQSILNIVERSGSQKRRGLEDMEICPCVLPRPGKTALPESIPTYHLRHITIRTGMQDWLRFTYDFESWYP
jgi:hypothetical protein